MRKMKNRKEKRSVLLSVNAHTRELLLEWKELHFPGERKTFDELIRLLIDDSSKKNPDPFRWNIPRLERQVLSLLEDNVVTSRTIYDCLDAEGTKITLRSVENALESLRRKRLIERVRKGKEYQYFILLEQPK